MYQSLMTTGRHQFLWEEMHYNHIICMHCNEQSVCIAYNYRLEIEQQLLRSIPQRVLALTQSGKVVRTAAGILRLNLLECSLLSWLLRRSGYGLVDLSQSSRGISLFEEDQNKQLLLLILLNAYYVKSYLHQGTLPELDAEILSLIPDFAKTYRGWRPDAQLKNEVLLEISQTFSNWTLPQRKTKPDYNQLVNKILELSKTYNVAANEDAVPLKKRKPNEELSERPEEKSPSERGKSQQNSENRMMLRSKSQSVRLLQSRFSEPSQQFNNNFDIFEVDDRGERNQDLLRRSSRNINTSGFMNFGEVRETRNIFSSRYKINNSILESHTLPYFRSDDRNGPQPKIKPTESFDRP